ncbi:MAG: hypothetical protein JO102_05125, partial [Elusimicrobia bacterium]|nr:hypothetical protein [Elusimicrobiota bacterium]
LLRSVDVAPEARPTKMGAAVLLAGPWTHFLLGVAALLAAGVPMVPAGGVDGWFALSVWGAAHLGFFVVEILLSMLLARGDAWQAFTSEARRRNQLTLTTPAYIATMIAVMGVIGGFAGFFGLLSFWIVMPSLVVLLLTGLMSFAFAVFGAPDAPPNPSRRDALKAGVGALLLPAAAAVATFYGGMEARRPKRLTTEDLLRMDEFQLAETLARELVAEDWPGADGILAMTRDFRARVERGENQWIIDDRRGPPVATSVGVRGDGVLRINRVAWRELRDEARRLLESGHRAEAEAVLSILKSFLIKEYYHHRDTQPQQLELAFISLFLDLSERPDLRNDPVRWPIFQEIVKSSIAVWLRYETEGEVDQFAYLAVHGVDAARMRRTRDVSEGLLPHYLNQFLARLEAVDQIKIAQADQNELKKLRRWIFENYFLNPGGGLREANFGPKTRMLRVAVQLEAERGRVRLNARNEPVALADNAFDYLYEERYDTGQAGADAAARLPRNPGGMALDISRALAGGHDLLAELVVAPLFEGLTLIHFLPGFLGWHPVVTKQMKRIGVPMIWGFAILGAVLASSFGFPSDFGWLNALVGFWVGGVAGHFGYNALARLFGWNALSLGAATKFEFPTIRITDEEMDRYFGPAAAAAARAEGRVFYVRPLDPKADLHFLSEWKQAYDADAAWRAAYSARRGYEPRLPMFGYIAPLSAGLVSVKDGQERLEGYLGGDVETHGYDYQSGRWTFRLGLTQMESYYRNIGRDRDLPGVSDLLWDFAIKFVAEDGRFTGGIEANAVSRGSIRMMDRRGVPESSGLGRSAPQDFVVAQARTLGLHQRFNHPANPGDAPDRRYFIYPAGDFGVEVINPNRNHARTSEGAVSVGASMLYRQLYPNAEDFPRVVVAPSGPWIGEDGAGLMQLYFLVAANFFIHGRRTTIVA